MFQLFTVCKSAQVMKCDWKLNFNRFIFGICGIDNLHDYGYCSWSFNRTNFLDVYRHCFIHLWEANWICFYHDFCLRARRNVHGNFSFRYVLELMSVNYWVWTNELKSYLTLTIIRNSNLFLIHCFALSFNSRFSRRFHLNSCRLRLFIINSNFSYCCTIEKSLWTHLQSEKFARNHFKTRWEYSALENGWHSAGNQCDCVFIVHESESQDYEQLNLNEKIVNDECFVCGQLRWSFNFYHFSTLMTSRPRLRIQLSEIHYFIWAWLKMHSQLW